MREYFIAAMMKYKDCSTTGIHRTLTVLSMLVITLSVGTFMRNRAWHDALTLWRDVADKSPRKRSPEHTARIYFGIGSEFAGRNDIESAMRMYRKAVELKPDYTRAHFELGLLYAQKKDMDQAMLSFRKVIDLKIQDNAALNAQHLTQDRQSRPDDLLEKAYNNLGSALYKKGEYREAIAQYSSALSLNPAYSDACFNRGLAYRRIGPIQKALRDFQTSCQLGNTKGCDALRE